MKYFPKGDLEKFSNDSAKTSTNMDTAKTIREPLSTFDLFPRLPTEIRLKVWRCHEPLPATLSLDGSQNAERRAFTDILHSRHEAREEFVADPTIMHHHSGHMSTSSKTCYIFCKRFLGQPGFFIDFSCDIIEISFRWAGQSRQSLSRGYTNRTM